MEDTEAANIQTNEINKIYLLKKYKKDNNNNE